MIRLSSFSSYHHQCFETMKSCPLQRRVTTKLAKKPSTITGKEGVQPHNNNTKQLPKHKKIGNANHCHCTQQLMFLTLGTGQYTTFIVSFIFYSCPPPPLIAHWAATIVVLFLVVDAMAVSKKKNKTNS
mmetsp:Transcript_21616/g.34625  ORF Transcript_21616/g.34625 Transcript_21616/m.34625 type:complete len:129 (-) Transcript_21616:1664-2050(-)